MKFEAKRWGYLDGGLDGLSAAMLKDHYTLYKNYVAKCNELSEGLKTVAKDGNSTFSPHREMLVELSFAKDAVKLHEGYFGNMGGAGGKPEGAVFEALERGHGSYDAWLKDFRSAALSARGWVVTALDLDTGYLWNYICDSHNSYGIWNTIPCLVLDVYEHAYMIDYGIRRADYLDAFMNTLDWEKVAGRFERASAARAAVCGERGEARAAAAESEHPAGGIH